ncbi:MAG: substrate-binding domain-containing protein [Candidatus Woesearchaeota archaeon]|jgi:ABC-type sugar transport system substrate-binding protein
MFRKVTKTGPATLTVALPTKWVKEHNIKAGQYINIDESNAFLSLSVVPEKEKEEITIQYNDALIERMLEKLFLDAESSVIIKGENIPHNIQKIIKKFPGLQITDIEKNKIVISRTLKPSLDNPSAVLRRCYLLIKEALDENPPNFSYELQEMLFLLQLYQNKSKEIFLLREIHSKLLELETPTYDDAYALIKTTFTNTYTQKYTFSQDKNKNLINLFKNKDQLFEHYFSKNKMNVRLSKLYNCINLIEQLYHELVYTHSIDVLNETPQEQKKKLRVGVCLKMQSNKFWAVEVKESMEQTAKDLKDIEFIFESPITDFDVIAQEKILEKFISMKVQGIIFAPIQPGKYDFVVKKINKLNIPLLILDTDIELPKRNYTYIGFDNYKGGNLTGENLKKILKKNSNLLVLDGHSKGNFSKRVTGFQDAMTPYHKTNVLIGEFQESVAFEKTLNYLKKNKVDAIFAISDNMALGAIKATEKMKLNIPICGFDRTAEGINAMNQGKLLSDINTKPREMGVLAIQTMQNLIRKKEVPERIEYSVELILAKKQK